MRVHQEEHMGIGTAANTHRMYDTVGHEHLDGLVNWAIGEFPDTGLLLIECRDGRWFVEVEPMATSDQQRDVG